MKILLAEDQPKVQSFIKQALEEAGMVVDAVSTLTDLLTSLKTSSYEAIVLDRMLRGSDSLEVIAEIKRSHPQLKILVLSAISEVEEKVRGLTEGADDYLGKPFHVSELIARLRSLTRRGKSQNHAKATHLTYEDLHINLESQRVTRAGKRIDLTGKEFRMLCLFTKYPGKIFSRMDLLDQVWDMNHFPESNVVEVTIATLRSKIDKEFKPLIHSRRGVGYWLGEE